MIVNLSKINTSLPADRLVSLASEPITSLYLHVPFCRLKCRYCDFYSLATSEARDMAEFVTSVLEEASWWADHLAKGSPISTVFFGGGTPSALPPDQMRRLLEGLRSMLPFTADVEWTIEANPATVDLAYCRMLLQSGVNRLSIGAQSFVDSELHMLGRIHDADEIRRTVDDAKQAGFGRLSIDLMYAVPGQTLESWEKSLQTAVSLGLKHISCYCLTLEEGTPMFSLTRSGKLPAIDEQTQLSFMRSTRHWLREHGLLPYEISNYATPGEECRHNLVYWNSGNYLGLGPAAASHVAGRRWRNSPDLRSYLDCIGSQKQVPVSDVEELTAEQRATELIMLMLRRSSGLSWSRLRVVSGFDGAKALAPAVARLTDMGYLSQSGEGIQLTDEGCYVADEVISELCREVS